MLIENVIKYRCLLVSHVDSCSSDYLPRCKHSSDLVNQLVKQCLNNAGSSSGFMHSFVYYFMYQIFKYEISCY